MLVCIDADISMHRVAVVIGSLVTKPISWLRDWQTFPVLRSTCSSQVTDY